MEKARVKRLDRLRLRLVEESCASCIPSIRRELDKIEGVQWVGANPVLDLIFVDYDPGLIDVDRIVSAIKKSGYTAFRTSA